MRVVRQSASRAYVTNKIRVEEAINGGWRMFTDPVRTHEPTPESTELLDEKLYSKDAGQGEAIRNYKNRINTNILASVTLMKGNDD